MAAELASVAAKLAAPGKGLLASDESTGTIGKRLEKAGLPNTEEIRRAYRELYYTTPGFGQYISGVIMYKETLGQSTADGRRFVDVLAEQGILAGIKVDEECGLVPVVEPEILIDGDHTQVRGVVPPAIPGIMFLSGGQTEEEATRNLNAINLEAQAAGRCPWALSFSFGRALQASVLKLWSADQSRVAEAQALALELARVNSEASLGRYSGGEGAHPSTLSVATLRETFRGWNGGDAPGGAEAEAAQ
ncbi:Fructose-bisphosphate aldolase B [Tetrabaena socialis]|uniref:fructose-bisphosphate aldolase n=1 Tax=Tetrabaena socialis TaxID=47790 RepID=A0A2J8ADS4_9CHLO|nr:Fructose-bisphosphate aldolase B [Tetrabaena socialis]|eukprot:PNH10678.1 Fructose-bisphosphate aldolase B [Tetrabaena socialis]